MKKNLALEALVDITNSNLGYIPSTPAEFNELSRMIQQKTGRSISLSSIKRIWGYVRYEGFPSVTTLNTLAMYNEFKDWETFLIGNTGDTGEESCFIDDTVINAEDLNVGDKLLLTWDDEKSCEIECIEPLRFRVNASRNIKLEVGDTLSFHSLCIAHPIYICDICRGNISFPAYIGARKGGLSSVSLIQ